MSLRRVATAVAMLLLIGGAGPAVADDESTAVKLTPQALQTMDEGDLAIAPVGSAQEIAPALFALPVSSVSLSPSGKVRAIRLEGGLRLSGDSAPLDLTRMRLNLPSRQATVKDSASGVRVAAFDVGQLKVTQRRVRGVLVIAPGASAVFNEQFDTYVFSDGMRFARFSYPLR